MPAGAELHELDIRDGDGMLPVLDRGASRQAVFHLAAQADVRVSVEDPGFDADVNVRGTIAGAGGARTTGARVVFSSTGGALYGEADTIPSPESTAVRGDGAVRHRPSTAPSTTSSLSNRLYGTRHVILRYGNVYGPRQDPHGEAGVVAIFFGKLAVGRDAARSSATASRPATTSTSATWSRANLAALDYAGRTRPSTSAPRPRPNVIDLLAGLPARGRHGRSRPSTGRRGWASSTAAASTARWRERELGWRPAMGLAEGLAETLRALHP